jgi:hypothetical protein
MDDQSTTDSTTLADDEILSVQDEETAPTTGDDADGDDTDTTDGDDADANDTDADDA